MPIKDPLSNAVLGSEVVYTNWTKKREVQQFLDHHPGCIPNGWTSRVLPLQEEAHSHDDPSHGASSIFQETLFGGARRNAPRIALVLLLIAAALKAFNVPPLFLNASEGNYFFSEMKTFSEVTQSVDGFPKGSKLRIYQDPAKFLIVFPMKGMSQEAAFEGGFFTLWVSFLILWTKRNYSRYRTRGGMQVVLQQLFSLPFGAVALYLMRGLVGALFETTEILLSPERLILVRHLYQLALNYAQVSSIKLGDITKLAATAESLVSAEKLAQISIEEGTVVHSLGERLTEIERAFVVNLIREYIQGYGKT